LWKKSLAPDACSRRFCRFPRLPPPDICGPARIDFDHEPFHQPPSRAACAAGLPVVARMKKSSPAGNLLQSGLIFSVISFVTNLGNFAFQSIMARHLTNQTGSYGDANSTLNSVIPLLGMLPAIATLAVTHYIAHFNACGDTARLQGLLAGCRKFLFRLTLASSLIAIVAIKPLGYFLNYPDRLMMVTLACTLVGLWVSLVTALCQGLSGFRRLALIGFLSMVLRVLFGWFVTLRWPSAETVVLASVFMALVNMVLLFWRKEFKLTR
jgi:hypothetical protein